MSVHTSLRVHGSTIIQRFRGPTGVLVLTTVGNMIVRLISSLLLTRMLDPSVFGLIAIIGSVFFVIVMTTDLGFEAFLVRHPRSDDEHFRNVIWTIHAFRGILLTVVGVVLAPLVTIVLEKPALTIPLAVSSVVLGINGFASFSLIIALKSGGAKKLSLMDFALTVFQAVLCIGLAAWLRNVWAFVIAMIAQSFLKTTLSYVIFGESSQNLARSREIRKEFFLFSRIVFFTSLVTLLLSQSDKLFLARILTLQQYGLYAIAINLVSVPAGFVGIYISRNVYPHYTKIWNTDSQALPNMYYTIRQRTSLLFALGAGILVGAAPLIVSILYDTRYRGAAPYVSLLGVSAALKLPTFAAAEVMTAIGKVSVTLQTNIVRIVWLVIAGPIGFYLYGAIGVIGAVGLLEMPALVYSWAALGKACILDMRYELSYLAAFLGSALLAFGLSQIVLLLITRWF